MKALGRDCPKITDDCREHGEQRRMQYIASWYGIYPGGDFENLSLETCARASWGARDKIAVSVKGAMYANIRGPEAFVLCGLSILNANSGFDPIFCADLKLI